MPIASADSKESDQKAHKSLPSVNHFKSLRKTESYYEPVLMRLLT